jgi:hypothetical protein
MSRETKELEIARHKIVAKTYLTARENHAVQQAYFKGTKLEVVGDQPKISEFNPAVQFEVAQELLRQAVISIDGKTDGIVDYCLEFPSQDFDAIVAELDTLVAKKKR